MSESPDISFVDINRRRRCAAVSAGIGDSVLTTLRVVL